MFSNKNNEIRWSYNLREWLSTTCPNIGYPTCVEGGS